MGWSADQQKDGLPRAKGYLDSIPSYAVSETVDEIKARFGLPEVVYLASNENPYGCSPKVSSALASAVSDGHRYPDGAGRQLKSALASAMALSPEQILLGNGSNEILDCVIKAFVGRGDDLLVSAHSFGMYPIMAAWVGANVIQVPMTDWRVDLEAVVDEITDQTKLVLLANANNPTGTMLSQDELDAFMQKVPSDILVVMDEAYIEFAEPSLGSALPLTAKYRNLIVCRTFSKAYGLAGLRIGYGIGDSEIISILEKVRQPFNVNMLALISAFEAFEDQAFLSSCVDRNRSERQALQHYFAKRAVRSLPSQANFIAIQLPGMMSSVYEFLLSQGVIVRRLTGYDMPDWLRVSVGKAEENKRFMTAMDAFLEARA